MSSVFCSILPGLYSSVGVSLMEFDAGGELIKMFTYVGQWFMPHRYMKTWNKYPLTLVSAQIN
jgi:hypothetical protein